MTLLLVHLWPGLAVSLVLGAALGALVRRPGRWTIAGHFALLAGLAVAAFLASGRAGLWLEAAASMLAAYLLGATVGGLARRPGASRIGVS